MKKFLTFLVIAVVAIGSYFAFSAKAGHAAGVGASLMVTGLMGLPMRRGSMQSIEQDADQYLSSFDGFAVPAHNEYAGNMGDASLVGYDGYGDDLLDFDGVSTTFKNEIESNRRFTITINNSANASDRVVVLFESYDPSSANIITDGAFLSVEGTAMNASTPFGKIKALRSFVYSNPTRCLGFKVESDQVSQISKSLTLVPKSPFQNLTDKTIYFADYTNEHVYQDKKVSIPYRFQVSNQTEVRLVVAANAITTITFFFGAILNTHKALLQKADAAAIGQRAGSVRL